MIIKSFTTYKLELDSLILNFKNKTIDFILSKLRPGSERFYSYNGKLLVVKPGRNYYCNFCLSPARINNTFDCHYCTNCNIWLEDNCNCGNCRFCSKNRPATPEQLELNNRLN